VVLVLLVGLLLLLLLLHRLLLLLALHLLLVGLLLSMRGRRLALLRRRLLLHLRLHGRLLLHLRHRRRASSMAAVQADLRLLSRGRRVLRLIAWRGLVLRSRRRSVVTLQCLMRRMRAIILVLCRRRLDLDHANLRIATCLAKRRGGFCLQLLAEAHTL
jgi:hypothetical protein